MIAVIDYGAGNLRSVVNAFDAIGEKTTLTNDPLKLEKASAVILPGVGAFGNCISSLRKLHLIETINELVVEKKRPFLGICLGFQFIADQSLENGDHQGLGWIGGQVTAITPDSDTFRVPHMGWNDVEFDKTCPLFKGFFENPVFYFVHSYHFAVSDHESVKATCWHGQTIVASVQKDNIFGVQFHPEKSQENGLKLLKNFINII